MPNWAENTLTVSGGKKQLKQFMKFAKGENGDLDFDKFIPYPERYKKLDEVARKAQAEIDALPDDERRMFYKLGGETPKDGYNSGGYEWCRNNWGTKWNAHQLNMETHGDAVVYYFDTAWNPPEPVIQAMSKRFTELEFSLDFREEGEGYEGNSLYKGGEGESETRDIEPDADDEDVGKEAV